MPTDLEERESLMRRLIIQSDRALQAYLMTNPAAITDPAVEARMRVIELASPYLQKRRAALEAYRAAHLPQCHPSTTTGSTAASAAAAAAAVTGTDTSASSITAADIAEILSTLKHTQCHPSTTTGSTAAASSTPATDAAEILSTLKHIVSTLKDISTLKHTLPPLY